MTDDFSFDIPERIKPYASKQEEESAADSVMVELGKALAESESELRIAIDTGATPTITLPILGSGEMVKVNADVVAVSSVPQINVAEEVLDHLASRDAWLNERYGFTPDVPLEESGTWYLGATDCASLLGISKWGSPFTVYALYRNLVAMEEMKQQMQEGLLMEPFIAAMFYLIYRFPMRKVETVRHPVHRFLGASGDYQVLPDEAWWSMLGDLHGTDYSCFHGRWVNLDCKRHHFTVKMLENYGEEWTDQVQDYQIAQGVWQAKCYDTPLTIFFCAFGHTGDQMTPYVVMANDRLAAKMEKTALNFVHNHLIPGVQPEVGGSKADASCVKRMMPPAVDSKAIELTDERRQLCEELYNARKASAAAEFEQTRLENILKLEYLEATELATQYGPCTYRANKNGVRSLRFPGSKA